jgi:predicted RNA-binding protein
MGVICIFSTILFIYRMNQEEISRSKIIRISGVFSETLSKILAKFPIHNFNISIFP